MKRLTTNKDVSEMNMVELAHNSCFAKSRNATYRDFECEMDARDFIRKIGLTFGIFESDCEEMTNDEVFDEVMADWLQYGYDEKEGLLALLYRNLWAQANLYERLKRCEDLEEQGLMKIFPCKVGDYIYEPRPDRGMITEYIVKSIADFGDSVFIGWKLNSGIYSNLDGVHADKIGKTVFLTKAEAEEALKGMEREE